MRKHFLLCLGTSALCVSIAAPARAQNHDPVAVTDTYYDVECGNLTYLPVLDNDTDADNDTLTITGVSPTITSNGEVEIEGNQLLYSAFTWGFSPDTFQYTISDGNGGTATGTVHVHIDSANCS